MKYIVHPKTPEGSEPKVQTPDVSDISISGLLDSGLIALYREMHNLLRLSAQGKLAAADARDLRDTIKLLFDMKAKENELLKGMSDEELETQAKAVLNDQK